MARDLADAIEVIERLPYTLDGGIFESFKRDQFSLKTLLQTHTSYAREPTNSLTKLTSQQPTLPLVVHIQCSKTYYHAPSLTFLTKLALTCCHHHYTSTLLGCTHTSNHYITKKAYRQASLASRLNDCSFLSLIFCAASLRYTYNVQVYSQGTVSKRTISRSSQHELRLTFPIAFALLSVRLRVRMFRRRNASLIP